MENNKRELKVYHAVLGLVLCALMMVFIAYPLQEKFGMGGLVLTELFILLIAVAVAFLGKADLKQVFPVRKIRLAPFFGTLILWVGTFLLVMVGTLIIAYFFPDGVIGISQGLSEVFSSVNPILAVLIVCLLPAICEEALFRGTVENALMINLRSKWVVILTVGIVFGIFHGSIWRFLPTAMLGAALAYIRYDTNNMVYGGIFHFVNNLIPTLMSFALSGMGGVAQAAEGLDQIYLFQLGIYMIMGCVAPFAIYTGAYLLHKGNSRYTASYFPREHRGRTIAILVGSTALLFILGAILFAADMGSVNQLVNDTMKNMQ